MSATYVIAQGGGPTAVINQTLAGAVTEIRKACAASATATTSTFPTSRPSA